MAFTYLITDCENEIVTFTIESDIELSNQLVYNFSGDGIDPDTCFVILSGADGKAIPVTVLNVFDSCVECNSVEPTSAEVIIEDDVNLRMDRVMTINEPLLGIESSIIITNGNETHELFSYNLPFPQNYVGGYLVCDEELYLPWNVNFPTGATNILATAKTNSNTLTLKLPNIINWRYFQSLPQLALFFGVNATNDWLWYQQNGWVLKQRVKTRNDVGVYIDDYPFVVRDYDDNPDVNWTWEFFRVSDNAQLTVPISNEETRVVVTATQPLGATKIVDYSTVTVEGIENPTRWLISSVYAQNGQTNSPLQPLPTETELKFTANITGVVLEFIFDPSKINGQNGVKFTARNYQMNGIYTERNVIDFPVVRIPEPPLSDEYEPDCCDCLPELKLASSTSEELIKNDITGFAHKNKVAGDTCEFKIFKGNQLLTNNGVDYPNGFPNDPNVLAFIWNWKWYLVNHGQGCYRIEKSYTVAGIQIEEELGTYNLLEYTPENAQATARILYQNNFQTLWDEDVINYADSGFEDSYRFRGMFGRWQPNVMSSTDFSVLNENRVSSIKSKDTYLLNHFHATECHIKRLHKIVMHATLWRMSDHNPSNTLQEKKIYECVLDPESKEDITYNAGSRVTGIEIVLSKRQQNSVSLFSGSIQTPQGATWFLPTVTGSGDTCLDATVTLNGSTFITVPSGATEDIELINEGGSDVVPLSVVGSTITLDDKLYLIFNFEDLEDLFIVNITPLNVGTFTSQVATNIGVFSYSSDGITFATVTYPFTPLIGTGWFRRSNYSGSGILQMIGI